MLSDVLSPVAMPRCQIGSRDPAISRANVADVIWALHSILVNPASVPDDAKSARRQMLQILDETDPLTFPQTIVLPLSTTLNVPKGPSDGGPKSVTVYRPCPRPPAATRPRLDALSSRSRPHPSRRKRHVQWPVIS